MQSPGFLGTGAPLSADITLAIEIAMGLALVLGMVLARRQRYRAHAWCQSTVVVLNLIVIALVMLPTFRSQVEPKIPARLARPYYAVATAHAAMGCIAELLGVYIILVAGTTILPERLRFVRYKSWMRTELLIWWLALFLGITTYVRWYIAPQRTVQTRANGMLSKAQPSGGEQLLATLHEKDAAPAVPSIDLHVILREWAAAVGDSGLLDSAKDLIELRIAPSTAAGASKL